MGTTHIDDVLGKVTKIYSIIDITLSLLKTNHNSKIQNKLNCQHGTQRNQNSKSRSRTVQYNHKSQSCETPAGYPGIGGDLCCPYIESARLEAGVE